MTESPEKPIYKAVETLDFGRTTGRVAYHVAGDLPPLAMPGAEWRPDPTFDEKTALDTDPGLKRVLVAARANGAVMYTPLAGPEKV